MEISIRKTKTMTTSKEPIGYNLEIDNRMVEQVMKFNYLGVNMTRTFMAVV